MRNTSNPSTETITQFRDFSGALWCAQKHYPKGKRDKAYWLAYVSKVGTTISIPCATEAQMWHEINIRRQQTLSL